MAILSKIMNCFEFAGTYLLNHPWVCWIKVEFNDNVVCSIECVGLALFLALDFKRTAQITLNIKNLSVKQDECVSCTPVLEDNGVDSLLFNLSQSFRIVVRVGSIEGVHIELSTGNCVVAVLVDRSCCIV